MDSVTGGFDLFLQSMSLFRHSRAWLPARGNDSKIVPTANRAVAAGALLIAISAAGAVGRADRE